MVLPSWYTGSKYYHSITSTDTTTTSTHTVHEEDPKKKKRQTCPKCGGTGFLDYDPGKPEDIKRHKCTCPLCLGRGMIMVVDWDYIVSHAYTATFRLPDTQPPDKDTGSKN